MTKGSPTTVQYRRVLPKRQPRSSDHGSIFFLAATPVMGSRLLFPRAFDNAVQGLLDDPASDGIRPQYARWYFGSAQRFEIDPARLRRRLSDFVQSDRDVRWIGTSFLDGADWSGALNSIGNSPIHRELSELIAADLDYRGTRSYRVQLKCAAKGRPVRRNGIALIGREEIDAYYRYCADLVASVRTHGILSRHSFGRLAGLRLEHPDARPPGLDSAERDVGVAINADGELIRHLGGKHRTAIAQALGLPSMPVELRMVHVGWLRGEMERMQLPAHQALPRAIGELAGARRAPASAPAESAAPSRSER